MNIWSVKRLPNPREASSSRVGFVLSSVAFVILISIFVPPVLKREFNDVLFHAAPRKPCEKKRRLESCFDALNASFFGKGQVLLTDHVRSGTTVRPFDDIRNERIRFFCFNKAIEFYVFKKFNIPDG